MPVAATGGSPSFTTSVFGTSGGALALAGGSYLAALGSAAPAALPVGNASAWTLSAWVRCALPPAGAYAAVLEWGAAGDVGFAAAAGSSGTAAAAATPAASGLGTAAASLLVAGASVWSTGAVTTLAGIPCTGMCMRYDIADGSGTNAAFLSPFAAAYVPASGALVVTDQYYIRVISPAGLVTTLAGSMGAYADGQGTAATFSSLRGVAVIAASSTIVVADGYNNCVRLVSSQGAVSALAGGCGQVSGLADGSGTAARFSVPASVAVNQSTGAIIVADAGNRAIRLVSPLGVVSTIAGSPSCPLSASTDGLGTSACFANPVGVAIVPSSGVIVVADSDAGTIRFVAPTGAVSTFPFGFGGPTGVAVMPSSGAILVTSAPSRAVQIISSPTPEWPAGTR